MRQLIVGSHALASGAVTEHDLRRWYRRMYRDIYIPAGYTPTLIDHIDGTWLRSGRHGIVAGVAASALFGADWVDDGIAVEMVWDNTRPPPGIIARAERIEDDEITTAQCISVTTPARTAFDLGRHLRRGEALARMDALMRATAFSADDVAVLAERYRGARGIRQLRELLPLVDGGAESPRETRTRLLLLDAGFPRPTTQIPAVDARGRLVRMLDMGWEESMVAVEYDGDQHRTDRARYVKDIRAWPRLRDLGWDVIRVIKEDRDGDVLQRVHRALVARGWNGKLLTRVRPMARRRTNL
ncbi:hypothetical protein [Mycolicibacterium goodii]|uniref:Cullin, a subunit of E3 ubiquitin ligase n=1 Tax=Mycolicibacterium goodii TaxID=134601 RepID=A0ABS6HM15_MYCGD|nr:hypothetical protein [Mycolicibacterium goodii]MBU8822714.1 hypothetical protein [Mycolicibacterium goodii]MBU8839544.1 hypothetical protein [Mycolicibacterium goodii]OKH72042.1 hypothetical protein EB74_24105 [Mycobacterium sp. SWH-M5]